MENETKENLVKEITNTLTSEVKRMTDSAVAEIKAQYIQIHDRSDDDPKAGFKSLGDFALHVRNAAKGQVSEQFKKWTKANQTTNDSDVALPVAFAPKVEDWSPMYDSIVNKVRQIPMVGNYFEVPFVNTYYYDNADETAGMTATNAGNATAVTVSKFKTSGVELKTKLVTAIVEVPQETDEAYAAYIGEAITSQGIKIVYRKAENQLIKGIGDASTNRELTGILNHASVVKVTRKTSSHLDVVDFTGMIGSYCGDRATALFVLSPSAEGEALSLVLGNTPLIQDGKIRGIPYVVSPACAALGSTGDAMLMDTQAYLLGVKGGTRVDSTIALGFDTNTKHYRVVLPIDGKPGPQAPYNLGTDTNGPFVSPFVHTA